jgi:adenylate cyclase
MTRAAEELEAIRDILRAISESPFDLDGTLAKVVERLVKLCGASFGMIYLPQADGSYRGAAAFSMNPEFAAYERENATPVTPGTLVGRVVLSGDVIQIEDAATDPAYTWKEGQLIGGVRTMLGVPIRTEERLIGVVGMARTERLLYTQDDIELVRTFADQAAVVIENVRLLKTVESQREQIAEYLPATVVNLIGTPEGEQLLAGHRREVSAVYCDLRGFTAFSEEAEPEEVLTALRLYHREMGEIIVAHDATLGDYSGDGMMIFLNDPPVVPDHPLEAVRMALEMRSSFEELSAGWRREGHDLGIGIGIAVGFASLGRIGFKGHYGYAVIGSVANLAARLCAAAPASHVYLSSRAYSRVESSFVAESLGSLELKGFRRPVEAFDLIGARGGDPPPPPS